MRKLDVHLSRHHAEYVAELARVGAARMALRPLRVLLRFDGDTAKLAEVGFHVESQYGDVFAGSIGTEDLEKLDALEGVVHVEAEQMRHLQLDKSVPEIGANQVWKGTPSYTGKGVIIGVVDTGIDVFHHCFRNANGTTRIRYIWDMTLTATGGEKAPPEPQFQSGGPVGVEFDQPAIQAALNSPNAPFRHQDLDGHGTHVAGIAAGNGLQMGACSSSPTYVGVAPDADLIAVKFLRYHATNAVIPTTPPFTLTVALPGQFRFDTWVVFLPDDKLLSRVKSNPDKGEYTAVGGVYTFNTGDAGKQILIKFDGSPSVSSIDYLRGVAYVFQRAMTAGPLGVSMPAVVNLSIGGSQGAHDGTSNEERALDYMVTATTPVPPSPPPSTVIGVSGRAIVVASGNDGNHGNRGDALHASGSVPANGTVSFKFEVPEYDYESDTFDLWYSGTGQLSFQLTSPLGGTGGVGTVVAPGGSTNETIGKDTLIVASTLNSSQNGKGHISVTLAPPAPPADPAHPDKAPEKIGISQGQWTITLRETSGAAVDNFDCWISISLEDGYPKFVTPSGAPVPGLTVPDPARTVTLPGTARNVITVGSYDPGDGKIAGSSGSGPTLDNRTKPDICAPGVGIMAPKTEENRFDACCHCCLDYYQPLGGTSMAAPHVSGVVALMFQKNPSFDFLVIRDQLRARGRPATPATPLPDNDWGWGKVDAMETVRLLPAPTNTPPNVGGPLIATTGPADSGAVPVSEPSGFEGRGAVRSPRVTVPIAANWWAYLPTKQRLRDLARRLKAEPVGQLLVALVSTHFDEVLRLINTNRRVAVRWHRLRGPDLIWEAQRLIDDPSRPIFPAASPDWPVRDLLDRLLARLQRHGSAELRQAVVQYRPLVLAISGRSVDDLTRSSQSWMTHGQSSWNARTHCA